MSRMHAAAAVLSTIPVGISRFARKAQRGEFLTVLCYHRVLDIDEGFPYDSDLVSASTDQFRSQLRHISRHYGVINFKQLKERLDETGKLPGNSLVITFDDGYRDNYEVAWPILREFGMTATFFVATGFMGGNRLFWWDRLAWIVKKAVEGRLEIPGEDGLTIDLADFPDRQEAVRKVVKGAKFLPEREKEELITRLSSQLGVDPDAQAHSNMMDWDQLREMDASGMEIGAHSVGHPIFSNIDEDRLRSEVAGPMEKIRSELGTDVVTFGSPGRGILSREEKTRFEKTLRRIVIESGYSFSTMYRWGLVHSDEFDPYAIERLGIETHDTERSFRAKLAFPEIVKY